MLAICRRIKLTPVPTRVAALLGVDRTTVSRWWDVSNVHTHKAYTRPDARVKIPAKETVRDWFHVSNGGAAKAYTRPDARVKIPAKERERVLVRF